MRGSFGVTGVLAVAIASLAFTGCGADPGDTGSETQALGKCDGERACSSDEYCFRPIGTCSGAGRCDPKPDACIQIFDPACGCDGVTYSNACFAAMMGASAASPGRCKAESLPSPE